MEVDTINIGKRIRYFRNQENISQEDLALFADVSHIYISSIERGEKLPSLKTIISIANALHVSTDLLLADSLEKEKDSPSMRLFLILNDCSAEENSFIMETIVFLKSMIKKHRITK